MYESSSCGCGVGETTMRRIGLLLLTSESEEILCDSDMQMKSESGPTRYLTRAPPPT